MCCIPEGTSFSDIITIIKDIVTFLAVIIGGGWAYIKFVKYRLFKAKLKLGTKVVVFKSKKTRTVHLTLKVQNIGSSKVNIEYLEFRTQQIHPEASDVRRDDDNTEYKWPELDYIRIKLDECLIEPGEIEQFTYDFVDTHSNSINVILLYASIKQKGSNLEWQTTDYIDLRG